MKKCFNTTSKKEYKTPLIEIEEMEKQDVLLVSASNNIEGDADLWLGDSGGIGDLFDAILGNDY